MKEGKDIRRVTRFVIPINLLIVLVRGRERGRNDRSRQLWC